MYSYNSLKTSLQQVSTSSIGEVLASNDLQVGIDALHCRFRIKDTVLQSQGDWQKITAAGFDSKRLRAYTSIPFHEKCTIRLGVEIPQMPERGSPVRSGWEALSDDAMVTAPGLWATIQVNPSRMIDPEGTRAVPATEVLPAIEMICPPPWLSDWITWTAEPSYWDLYRLDLTVDVETPEITQQVLAVAQRGLRSPRQKVNTFQVSSGDLETVRVVRKTKPNLSIYDKAKQSRTGPPRVRFEVQLNRSYLRDNIPTLGDLTERTARISFQHQMKPVIDALKGDKRRLDDLRLDRAEKKTLRELCGHEWLRDHGYNDTPTKSEQKRYRDFENKYDIRWVGDLF